MSMGILSSTCIRGYFTVRDIVTAIIERLFSLLRSVNRYCIFNTTYLLSLAYFVEEVLTDENDIIEDNNYL